MRSMLIQLGDCRFSLLITWISMLVSLFLLPYAACIPFDESDQLWVSVVWCDLSTNW
jgi:hypothetical protein